MASPACSSASGPARPAPRAACSVSACRRSRPRSIAPRRAMPISRRPASYVPIITDGGMSKGGDVCKALACGSDAVMVGSAFARAEEAPGRGHHWGMATPHANLPRGTRIHVGVTGTLKQILFGPATVDDGSQNLVGAIMTCMGNVGASHDQANSRKPRSSSPPRSSPKASCSRRCRASGWARGRTGRRHRPGVGSTQQERNRKSRPLEKTARALGKRWRFDLVDA